MGREQYAALPCRESSLKMPLDLQCTARIQAVECLVQHDELRLAEQCEQDAQLLSRAQRARVHELVEIARQPEGFREPEQGWIDLLEPFRVRIDLQALR